MSGGSTKLRCEDGCFYGPGHGHSSFDHLQ